MAPSWPPRKSTPWGTTTPTRPLPSMAVAIMWLMKAQSPLLLGGMPRVKRAYRSSAAISCPHLSRLKGGFATTVSNFIRASFSTSWGWRIVSSHSMRAASTSWRNMFILHRAQVLPFISCPNREKLLDPTCWDALMSNEPEPQVGSEMRSPSCGLTRRASVSETAAGV